MQSEAGWSISEHATAPRARRVECPDEETVLAFVDGTLAAEARADLVSHLAGCPLCSDLVAASAGDDLERTGSRAR